MLANLSHKIQTMPGTTTSTSKQLINSTLRTSWSKKGGPGEAHEKTLLWEKVAADISHDD